MQTPASELDSLEFYIASNPDTINSFLDCKFKDLQQLVNSLGFDATTIIRELEPADFFSDYLWVQSVGISKLEFLELTVIEYCHRFPETGAPLVALILDSIRLSEEQAELLAKAGGTTNLTKANKWEIGLGAVALAGTLQYLIGRGITHSQMKEGLISIQEKMEGKNFEQWAKGESFTNQLVDSSGRKLEYTVSKGKLLGWKGLDVKFESAWDRAVFEWRSQGIVKVWNHFFPRNSQDGSGNSDSEEIKSIAESQLETDTVDEVDSISHSDADASEISEVANENLIRAEIRPGEEFLDLDDLVRSDPNVASKSMMDMKLFRSSTVDERISFEDGFIGGTEDIFNAQIARDVSQSLGSDVTKLEKVEIELIEEEVAVDIDETISNVEIEAEQGAKKLVDKEVTAVISEAEKTVNADLEAAESDAIDKLEV